MPGFQSMIDSLDDELVKARADLSERQRLLVKAQTELATHSRRQQARRSAAESTQSLRTGTDGGDAHTAWQLVQRPTRGPPVAGPTGVPW